MIVRGRLIAGVVRLAIRYWPATLVLLAVAFIGPALGLWQVQNGANTCQLTYAGQASYWTGNDGVTKCINSKGEWIVPNFAD